MRVGTNHQYETYAAQIQQAGARYFEAQQRVLSGKRFTRPSEDPAAARFVVSAETLKSRTAQLDANLRNAKDYLGNTESALSDLATALNRAYVLAVNGANGTYSQADLDGMANEVSDLQDRLAALGNTQTAAGRYLFAGQESATKPFTETPPTLTFNGDDLPVSVEVRPGETMRVNLQGAGALFQNAYAALETLKNDLRSGNAAQIGNNDIQALQDQLKTVAGLRGDTGSKLQTVGLLTDQNQRRIDDLTRQVSDAQDIDLSDAVTRMQAAQTAYAAALQVTAQGQGLSLMDYLR